MLLPGVTTLARLIAQICERTSSRFFKKLSSVPNPSEIEKLNELLEAEFHQFPFPYLQLYTYHKL